MSKSGKDAGGVRYADCVSTALGDLWIVVNEDGALVQVDFDGGRNAPADRDELVEVYAERGLKLAWNRMRVRPSAKILKRTLKGSDEIGALEVAPEGTPFQLKVWKALRRIPHGKTWSYAQLAKQVGCPGAARAVGAANGANPVSIAIPCHRVIGSDGKLTGYGGGVDRKRALLVLEGALSV